MAVPFIVLARTSGCASLTHGVSLPRQNWLTLSRQHVGHKVPEWPPHRVWLHVTPLRIHARFRTKRPSRRRAAASFTYRYYNGKMSQLLLIRVLFSGYASSMFLSSEPVLVSKYLYSVGVYKVPVSSG